MFILYQNIITTRFHELLLVFSTDNESANLNDKKMKLKAANVFDRSIIKRIS